MFASVTRFVFRLLEEEKSHRTLRAAVTSGGVWWVLQYLGEVARIQVGVAGDSWVQIKSAEIWDPIHISTLDRILLRSKH